MTTMIIRFFLTIGFTLALVNAPGAQPTLCPDEGPLGVTVPDSTLQTFENLRKSTFAHAYLLDVVAKGNPDHDVVRRAGLAVYPDAVEVPPDSIPTARQLLACLRAESDRVKRLRRDIEEIGGSVNLLTQATATLPEEPRELSEALVARLETLLALEARLNLQASGPESTDLRGAVSTLAVYAQRSARWQRCDTERRPLQEEINRVAELRNAVPETAVGRDSLRRDSLQRRVDRLAADRAAISECRDVPSGPPEFATAPSEVARTIQTEWRRLRNQPESAVQIQVSAGTSLGTAQAAFTGSSTVAVDGISGLSSLSSSGGDVPLALPTDVFIALTEYSIERVRDELVLAYLGRVQGRLNSSDWLWLQDLFPQTHTLARSLVDRHVGEFGLPVWRASLASDLRRLPIHAVESEHLLDHLLDGLPEADQLRARIRVRRARAGFTLVETLRAGERPLDVLVGLGALVDTTIHADDALRGPVLTGATLASRLAGDLRHQDVALGADQRLPPYILSERTLRQTSDGHRRAYRRLLLRSLDVPAGGDTLLTAVEQALGRVSEVLAGADLLAEARDLPASERVRAAGALMLSTLQVPLTLADPFVDTSHRAALERTEHLWATSVEVLTLVEAGDATAALSRSLTFLAEATTATLPTDAGLLPLLTLSASLADATTGDDMVRAFRATALPPGSYQARRDGRGAIVAVNLYPGIVGGAEWLLTSEADGVEEKPGVALGVSLPVGATIDFGGEGGGSHSVFVSVVDLGALLSYRLSNTSLGDDDQASTAITPNTSFRDVLAPGLHYVYGFPSTPIALTLGAQLMPSLRSVVPEGGSEDDARTAAAIRLGASLAFDLPLLNLSGARGD